MATQLKNILHFSLPSGGSQTLPHGLIVQNGRGVVPDHLEMSATGFTATADAVNVTVTGVGDVDVFVESWHTIERVFGDVATQHLVPQPFIPGGGGGGSNIPTPPFDVVVTTIYARATGSDTTGNGRTIPTAYRTFQRAIRDVPLTVAPGNRYIVDITGIGLEVLPVNYALPAINSPFGIESSYAIPGGMYPFQLVSALDIIAVPQPATGLSGPNVITSAELFGPGIVVEPDTNLIEIHTSQSYTADELKGKFAEDVLGMCGTIWHNTPGPNSIIYLTAASFPDQPTSPVWHPGGFSPFPVIAPPLAIVELSAEFQTNKNPNDIFQGGFNIDGSGSLGIHGVKIAITPAQFDPTANNIAIFGCRDVFFEACDLDGATVVDGTGPVIFLSTVVSDGAFIAATQVLLVSSHLQNLSELNVGAFGTPYFAALGFVIESCPALGVRYDPAIPVGRGSLTDMDLRNGVIRGAISDLNDAQIAVPQNFPAPFVPFSLNPSLATPGHGIVFRGGKAMIDHVKIFGCAADGIHVEAAFGLIEIKSVTGGQGGTVFGNITDAPNGNVGVLLTDGAFARVGDNDPVAGIASNVTGTIGAIQIGDAPGGLTSTWAAFHASKQLFDITAVGPGGATGSGSRMFEKP